MNIWKTLGIEPTRDVTAIRKAYAQAARRYHPEEQPEEFQRLHTAYEKALEYARTAPRPSGSGIGGQYKPPSKVYNSLGNKSVPKKTSSVFTGGSGSSSRGSRVDSGPRRRPRAQVEIVPLGGRKPAGPEPDWLREETAEGQAELFRRNPAIDAFRVIWQDGKKAREKTAWREYFTSPVFLGVQREQGFTAALLELVEKDVKNGRTIQQRFLQQLSIAYGIRSRSKTLYYLPNAAFPGIESIRNIVELGEGLESLGHEDDKVLAACWQDYFELITLAKNGGFEDPERFGRWKSIFDRYRREKVTDKPATTRRSEGEMEYRHPLGLRLLAFFVEKNSLPPEAIQYLYDTLKLETAATSSVKKTYQPLLDAVLPILPDQAAVKAEKEAMRLFYAALSDFLRIYDQRAFLSSIHVLRSYDLRPTQGQLREAKELIGSPQFQELFLTQKFKESSAVKRIMDSGTCLPALMAEEYAKHRGEPVADAMLEWCLSTVRSQEHDPEFFFDKPFVYEDASVERVSLANREFWYYYLSTAFPAGLTTSREVPLAQILREHCHPSWGWRRVFTGFDEDTQRVSQPRRSRFEVGGQAVTIEHHYFYQCFLTGEEPETEVEQLFPWEELAGVEDDLLFWLALPLAIPGETPGTAIRGEIVRRLRALPLDEIIFSDLADCLVNHVTTPKKKSSALLTGRMEDGSRLFGYEVRQNRTLEVFELRGILRKRNMLWERPFPNERLAREEAERYLNGVLDQGAVLVEKWEVKGAATAREKAEALVRCLGEGFYPLEEREADQLVSLSATEDFLGYGRKNHGGFTADFYEAHREHPYQGTLRFGSRPEEAFCLDLIFEIWPYGSPKAKKCGILAMSTRLGLVGTGCYAIGEIGWGDETFTLVSSDARRELYAMRDGTERMYSGKDLAELVEKMLYRSEWQAVEWVERYKD